ncbi:unnamed protein product [Auanema sp. JU1783]|nr:unnamed protein product [Auanema sp. JU1783]
MNSTEIFAVENSTRSVIDAAEMDACNQVDNYFIVLRFWLAVVLGDSLSVISIIFNSFVFLVFVTSKQHRNSYNLYLMLLAMSDVFIGISYISVLSVRVLFNWTANITLKSIWVTYMIPMLTVSHIGMTASTYLITFAAVERYCVTVNNWAVTYLQKNRKILAIVAMMCGLVSKGTILKEIQIGTNDNCIGTINEWEVHPSQLVKQHPWFNIIWRFYFRTMFTILAPFFILLYLNARLIFSYRLRNNRSSNLEASQDKQSVLQKKARIRAATRTLVIIVCTYLMSNLLQVIITIWEYLSYETLSTTWIWLYVLSVDWISLLTMMASCLRLPIYAICQPLLRKEMYQFISQLWTFKKMTRRMTLLENFNPQKNMQFFVVLSVVAVAAFAAPLPGDEEDANLGLAWHAAAGEVNFGRVGRFYVPRQVTNFSVSDSGSAKETVLEVIYQESWCSTDEGNDLEDVCESMCPLYQTGAQALYKVTTTEFADGNEETHAVKIKDL